MTEHDAEWTDDDTRAALEYQGEQDLLCPGGCGQPRDRSMADEDHAPRYVAEAVTCLACEQRDAAAQASRDDAGGERKHGVFWAVSAQR